MQMKHKVDTEGYQKVAAGTYHMQVVSIEDTTFESGQRRGEPCTKVKLQVKAGTNTDEINKVHTEGIAWYHGNEGVERMNQSIIALLAIACGVTMNNGKTATQEAIDKAVENGEDISFNWDQAEHKHICCEIKHSPDKNDPNKSYANINHPNIWAIDDPQAAQVPKDEKAISEDEAADAF